MDLKDQEDEKARTSSSTLARNTKRRLNPQCCTPAVATCTHGVWEGTTTAQAKFRGALDRGPFEEGLGKRTNRARGTPNVPTPLFQTRLRAPSLVKSSRQGRCLSPDGQDPCCSFPRPPRPSAKERDRLRCVVFSPLDGPRLQRLALTSVCVQKPFRTPGRRVPSPGVRMEGGPRSCVNRGLIARMPKRLEPTSA